MKGVLRSKTLRVYIYMWFCRGLTTYQVPGTTYGWHKLNCCIQRKCRNKSRFVGTQTVHTYPGPPRNRQTFQLALRQVVSRTAGPHRLWSFYRRLAQSDVFGFGNRSPTHQKKCPISGAAAFPRPTHQQPVPRPARLSCARAAAMCSIELVCCARSLGAMAQGIWSSVQKLERTSGV